MTLDAGGGDHTGKAADRRRHEARPDTAVGTGQQGHHLAKPEGVHSHRRVLALKGPGSEWTEGTVALLCPSRPQAVGFSKLSGWGVNSEVFSGPPRRAGAPRRTCSFLPNDTHSWEMPAAPGSARPLPAQAWAHPPLPWLPWLYVAPLGLSRPLRAPARWVCSSLGSLLGDPARGYTGKS